MSYCAHVGTDICIRTYNGPNLVYLKYKKKSRMLNQLKNNFNSSKYLHSQDINKFISNPELLCTLQTRNNCYPDSILEYRKIKKEKIDSNKKYEFPVKKCRGRPRKTIEVEPKKRGRPKKSNTITGSLNPSQNDKSLNYNPKTNKIKIEPSFETKPKLVHIIPLDAYNCKVDSSEKLKSLSSKMKFLIECAWKIINCDKEIYLDTSSYQVYFENFNHQTSNCKEKGKKDLYIDTELLESNFKSLIKEYQGWNSYYDKEKLDFILTKLAEKRVEYEINKQKMTDYSNGSATGNVKENILYVIPKIRDETELNIIKNDFGKKEKCEKLWLNDDHRYCVSSTLPLMINNNSKLSDKNDKCEALSINDDSEKSVFPSLPGILDDDSQYSDLEHVIIEYPVCEVEFEENVILTNHKISNSMN